MHSEPLPAQPLRDPLPAVVAPAAPHDWLAADGSWAEALRAQGEAPAAAGALERGFDIAFAAELALREKQIQQNYPHCPLNGTGDQIAYGPVLKL